MCRHNRRTCLAVLGICLCSYVNAEEMTSTVPSAATAGDQPGTNENRVSFVSWLGTELPQDHVQHTYDESGDTHGLMSWLLEASRDSCGGEASLAGAGDSAREEHSVAGEPDAQDSHTDHAADDHAGHAHRRLLQDAHDHTEDAHDHTEDEHSHGVEDSHAEDPAGVTVVATNVLTLESLEALNTSAPSTSEAVKQALLFISACRVDPTCMLEGGLNPAAATVTASAAADAEAVDSHAGHGHDDDMHAAHSGDGSAYLGLKLGLAATFLAMTIITSYLPILFMWSPHYHGILTCLNVFSGSVFLTVGLTHLLPHVAEYQAAAKLDTDYPVGYAVVIVGFLLVLFVEQIVFDVHGANLDARHADKNAATPYTMLGRVSHVARSYHSPLVTEGAVVLHAVLECIVLGLAGSKEDLWLLFTAICSHKVFTTMSQSARFLRVGCPPGLLFILLLPFHILPPLGVVLGAFLGSENATASLVLAALATGTFLYVGAFEVVSEEFAESCHSAGFGAAGGCPAGRCLEDGRSASGCIAEPVAPGDASDGGGEGKATAAAWVPSRGMKFAVFVCGCGVLLAVTAALPSHDDLHLH